MAVSAMREKHRFSRPFYVNCASDTTGKSQETLKK